MVTEPSSSRALAPKFEAVGLFALEGQIVERRAGAEQKAGIKSARLETLAISGEERPSVQRTPGQSHLRGRVVVIEVVGEPLRREEPEIRIGLGVGEEVNVVGLDARVALFVRVARAGRQLPLISDIPDHFRVH